jgi:aspartyl-tRNA(Asn)/glutamyl-tRNA(Gln) amidotransferase subunit B
MTDWETVIGLECHVELSTATKMFCACANVFGAEPNTNVCAVCLGQPGTLPVPNHKAIEYIMRIGLAVGSEIAPHSLFHRKNYFYPDMPKNFQISQYDLPVCVGGHLDIELPDGSARTIGITRVHMEEDTGKTTHVGESGRIAGADYSLVDYNRAGVPLVEVVSEPDMRSADEARAYLTELRATLEALGVSDVRMEEGSLRCDANVSVRPAGSTELGVKVEIKNLNSIRSLERAVRFESARQVGVLEDGGSLVQETRHWDEDGGATHPLRSKEFAFDYRYFPEPDLPPLEPSPEWIEEIRSSLPELPAAKRQRFETEYSLKPAQARLLAASRHTAEFFEEAVRLGTPAGQAANWLTQDVAAAVNETGTELEFSKLSPTHLADLATLLADGAVSSTGAKTVIAAAFASGDPIESIVETQGLHQVSDEGALGVVIDEVIAENPEPVAQFRGGKDSAIGFLVGQAMKKTRGSANPQLVQQLLRDRLSGTS